MSLDPSGAALQNRPYTPTAPWKPTKKTDPKNKKTGYNSPNNINRNNPKPMGNTNRNTLSSDSSVSRNNNNQVQQQSPQVSSAASSEFLSRTNEVNGGRTLQGVGQPTDVIDFFKKKRISYRGQQKFDDIWSTAALQGRSLYLNKERVLLDAFKYMVGYKIEGKKDSYGLMLFDNNGKPIERYDPESKTISNIDKNGNWVINKEATRIARSGGVQALFNYSHNASELHAAEPTVVHAENAYWKSKGIDNAQDYTVQYNTYSSYKVIDWDAPSDPYSMAIPYKWKTKTTTHTLSLGEYSRQKNTLEHNDIISITDSNGNKVPQAELNKIKKGIQDLDLQEVHDLQQKDFYAKNGKQLQEFFQYHPKVAVEKAHADGKVSQAGVDVINNAYDNNGKTEVFIPKVGGYESNRLTIFRDKDTQRSVMICYNPTTMGDNVIEFENDAARDAWFKDSKNKQTILSHFNAYELQDGIFQNGAKTDLEKFQGGPTRIPDRYDPGLPMMGPVYIPGRTINNDHLLSFEKFEFDGHNPDNALNNELISRDIERDKRNADVYIKSNSEALTDKILDGFKYAAMLGSVIAAPFTGGLSLEADALLIGAEAIAISLPEFVKSAYADTENERFGAFRSGMLNLALGLAIPIAAKGLGAAYRGIKAAFSEGAEAATASSSFLQSSFEGLEEETGLEIPVEETKPEVEAPVVDEPVPETLTGNVDNIPDNLKLSGDSLAREGRYPIFPDKNTGLHLNTRGGQFIKLDGEQTFIEVTPTGADGEYTAVGDSTVKFTRQADGTFEVRVGQAGAKYPYLGRVNDELPPEIEELAQPKASFGDNPPVLREEGYHRGLYKSSNGDLFVSPDEGESFIPVREEPGGGNLGKFRVKGKHDLVNRFVRQEDGSFDFEQPRNRGAGGPGEEIPLDNISPRGRVNGEFPDNVQVEEKPSSEWGPQERPSPRMIQSGNKSGLYRSADGNSYFISRDRGQSFIKVTPTANPDEFLAAGGDIKFTRQANGSFNIEATEVPELPNAPTQSPSSGIRGDINGEIPDNIPLDERSSGWFEGEEPNPNMIQSGEHEGLYLSKDGSHLYISRDGGQSFIPVEPTNTPNEFTTLSNDIDDITPKVKFTRQADGSFDVEVTYSAEDAINLYPTIKPEVQEKLVGLNWSSEQMEELNTLLSSKPESVQNEFSRIFTRTPEANKNDFAEIWMQANAGGRGGKGKFMSEWKRLLSENYGAESLPERKVAEFRTKYKPPTETPAEPPATTPDEEPIPPSELPKVPRDISKQIEKMDVSQARKNIIYRELGKLSKDDLKKLTETFRLIEKDNKGDLLFTWSAAKAEQRNNLLNAWLSKSRSRLPRELENMFNTTEIELPAEDVREIRDFLESLKAKNLSTGKASQLASEYLTRRWPNKFPSGGAAIRFATSGKAKALFIGSNVVVIGGISLIFYFATSSGGSQQAAINKYSDTRGTVYGSFPNNLVENKQVRDATGKVIGKVDNLGNILSPSGDIIKPSGELIGRYDNNNNIVDSAGNIRSPNGEILAENLGVHDTTTVKYQDLATGGVAYLDGTTLRNDNTSEIIAENVTANNYGELVDGNGNVVALANGFFQEQRYKHIESGETVRVQGNSLLNIATGEEVASNINASPRWDLKYGQGTDGTLYGRWYYYPAGGSDDDGYFVDGPGSTNYEPPEAKQKELSEWLKRFEQEAV